MENILSTFIRSIFVDNMVFAYYLGMYSYLAVSKNVKTALDAISCPSISIKSFFSRAF